MNMEKDEIWEAQMQENLMAKSVFSQICSVEPHEYTTWEKLKRKLRNALSYLTRYQIVDTWTMHDNCL